MQITAQAHRRCAEWLKFCLDIGWRRDQLDALQALWWKHHNHHGELI